MADLILSHDQLAIEVQLKAAKAQLAIVGPTDQQLLGDIARLSRMLTAPPYSEEAMALLFADRHMMETRYVPMWGKWMRYIGGCWREDHRLKVYSMTRAICREQAALAAENEKNGKSIAKAIASSKTVAAVVTLARADQRLACETEQWDNKPWLLCAPTCTVDLKTGETEPSKITNFLTTMTAVAPEGDCPLWMAFLDRVTGSNEALMSYLKRVAGYCLTGITTEHALFFLYGTGANGKSVFVSTIAGLLDGYHKSAPIETFTEAKGERHPTELAMLRGARLVSSVETEEGRRWAESRIKSLTGGDRIAARFMRQDFFEFTPQFKLLIAGNHKPGLRSVDEAIRRRFNLIPFTVTIPISERDDSLTKKLESERAGILQWAIEGCLEWQIFGLQPPEIVRQATAEYLEAEDAFSAWADECCEKNATWGSKKSLYASWKAWAERMGEHPGASKRFGQIVEAHGYQPHRKTEGWGYAGIAVKQEEPSYPDRYQ